MEKQKLKERKSKTQKGITLVALIITIIVLLILAIVSIRAIKDGGILSKTQTAKETYSESEEKEKIQLAINQAAIDGMGTINRTPLETALTEQFKDDFEITKQTEEYFKVKIKSSGRIYTINKNGSIDKIGESWADNENGSYTKGDETVKIGDTYTNDEVKSKLKDKGVECKDGSYTGKWEVIGIEDDEIKLVSVGNVTGSYTLGKNDPIVYKKDTAGNLTTEVIDEIVDSNGDGDLELEKAAWSYAHAVDTLDEVAQNATGITSARCITIDDIYDIIGEENVDKISSNPDYGKTYKYYCDDTTNGQVYYKIQNTDGSWPDNGSKVNVQPFTYTNSKKETVTIGTLKDGKTINKGEVLLTSNYFGYTLDPTTQKPAIGSLAEGRLLASYDCRGM